MSQNKQTKKWTFRPGSE